MNIAEARKTLEAIQPPRDLVRVRDAALMAGLNEETVRKRIRSGEIPAWGHPQRVAIADLLRPYVPGSKSARNG